MGCDVDSYLVKSDTVLTYDYENWWNWRREFKYPDIDGKAAEDIPPYYSGHDGGHIWTLFNKCKLNKLRDNNDAWCVVELSLTNIDILINKCKDYIHMLVDVESKEDFEKTELGDCFYNEELIDEYCSLLRLLRITKRILNDYPGYSIVAFIYY